MQKMNVAFTIVCSIPTSVSLIGQSGVGIEFDLLLPVTMIMLVVQVSHGVEIVAKNGLEVLKGGRIKELLLLEPSLLPLSLEALLLHLHLLTPQFVHSVEEWILHCVHANELQVGLTKPVIISRTFDRTYHLLATAASLSRNQSSRKAYSRHSAYFRGEYFGKISSSYAMA